MLLKSFWTRHLQMMNGLNAYSWIELVDKREYQKVEMKPTFVQVSKIGKRGRARCANRHALPQAKSLEKSKDSCQQQSGILALSILQVP